MLATWQFKTILHIYIYTYISTYIYILHCNYFRHSVFEYYYISLIKYPFCLKNSNLELCTKHLHFHLDLIIFLETQVHCSSLFYLLFIFCYLEVLALIHLLFGLNFFSNFFQWWIRVIYFLNSCMSSNIFLWLKQVNNFLIGW